MNPELLAEENARILSNRLSLDTYLRFHRTGSKFLISRADRKAIFAAFVAPNPVSVEQAIEFSKLGWTFDVDHFTPAQRANLLAGLGEKMNIAWISSDARSSCDVTGFDYEAAILARQEAMYDMA